MDLVFVCGCSRKHPCGRGAKYFAQGDWAQLERHLEQSVQVNRPYPEQQAERRPFATIGDLVRRRA